MASNTRLLGKKGLVVGVANPQSIAAGCARAFHEAGAELAVTYLNEKARPFAQPVGDGVRARIFAPLDVERPGEMTALFDEIQKSWGRLDFLLHSIAFCPKDDLQSRVTDCSREGFLRAMDVSVYSLIRLARLAEPMMADGGAILTVSYYGAEKAVDHYNVMGPVKAALESTVRALALELGPKGVRVNALSPGPIRTRAASGIGHFDELIDEARRRAPERRLVTLEEIGEVALALVDEGGRGITGEIAHVDAGLHAVA